MRLSRLAALLLAAPVFAAAAQQPLTLADAIALAQKQGYLGQQAIAARDAARARDHAFGARLLPQLTLTGQAPAYQRSITPVIQPDGTTLFTPLQTTDALMSAKLSQQIPFTGGTFSVSSSLDRLQVTGAQQVQTWTTNPVVVSLRQDILRPNRVKWDTREQDVSAEYAERQYIEAREDVALQTANAYFALYAAKMSLENATSNAGINDTLYTLNKGRFEVGKIGENDLLQSQLALLRARATLDGAKLDYDRALSALRLAVNAPAGQDIEVTAPSDIPTFDPDTTLAVQQARENRAQVLLSELADVRAKRRVTEAKLNNGIGATVDASLGFNSTAPDMNAAYKNLLQQQRFTLGVSMPIVQWGAHSADVQAAQADQRGADAAARASREQIAQDAKYAALQLSQARRNVALSAKADTVAAKRFDVAYARYVIGKIGVDNLYIAQNEKDSAMQQYVQALRGYWTAYYALRKATGYDFDKGAPIR